METDKSQLELSDSRIAPANEFHTQLHSHILRESQAEAYNRIREEGLLTKLRFLAYEAIYKLQSNGEGATSGEVDRLISQNKGRFTRSASPRLNELVKLGVLKELPRRKCSATGQTVIAYETTVSIPDESQIPMKPAKPSDDDFKETLTIMRRFYREQQAKGTAPGDGFVRVMRWLVSKVKVRKEEGQEGKEGKHEA